MTTQSDTRKNLNKNQLTVLFASSVLITLILFFVDEGYYNFSWMSNIGNWILFIVYVAVIFLGQLLFSKFLLRKYQGLGKTMLSIFGGATVGILALIFGIFTNW